MKFRPHLFAGLIVVLVAALLPPGPALHAQEPAPTGIVAFAGVDADDNAALYVLDLASGRVGAIDSPVLPEVSFQWHPEDELLAFTTADGGYGLLRSLRGCFDTDALCTDIVEVYPPFMVEGIVWDSTGEMLYLQTDEGLQLSPPRARPADITALETECAAGFALAAESQHLFCADIDAIGNTQATVYAPQEDMTFTLPSAIGTFPALTAYAIAANGAVAIGTEEAAGDSGFFAPLDGSPSRLSAFQIHVYDLTFHPDEAVFALSGATADSTGDGSLRDGDPGELFLFDTEALTLTQQSGFTGASVLAWSPSGDHLLVVTENADFLVFAPESGTITPLTVSLPAATLAITDAAWIATASTLPLIPTATPPAAATAIPTPTFAATLTPFPSVTPFPTLTPYPTFTPFPTATPIPSATPGSPMGAGCQYAYIGGGGLPFAVGDTVAVTNYGAAVRLRTAPALTAGMIAELLPGTTMTVLSGPYCGQGYRWWEVQLSTNNAIGYVADSDQNGLWVEYVETVPVESVSFYADRYAINPGECVTLRWDVEGIQAVYYQGSGVTGHETRTECPIAPTTYSLRVVSLDSTETIYQITIGILLSP